MAENFREFNPGNNPENGSSNTQDRKSGNGRSYGRIAAAIAGLLIVGVLAVESVYSVGEQEQGVVTTFGHAGSVVTS